MKNFGYLTFDCYGTLIDWRDGIEKSLGKALGEVVLPKGESLLSLYVGLEAQQEMKYRKYRQILRNIAKNMAAKLNARIAADAADEFAASVPLWPPFRDTVSSLKRLGSLGYKRYILSNIDNDLLRETIRRNRLEVDGFVTAEEVHSYKPAFAHWQRFLARAGAKKNEVLHVAQSVYHDIYPASRLGIRAAWVNRYGEPLVRNVAPWMICDNLRHLTSVLDQEMRR